MINFTDATVFTIAKALVMFHAARAKSADHFDNCKRDPHARDLAESFRAEVTAAERAMRELATGAAPHLAALLIHQLSIVTPSAAAPSPSPEAS